MNKVNYAVVFSSQRYRDLIYSTLNKNDVMFIEPVLEDEKSLSEYVKKGTAGISSYDAFVIDLGTLKDTDEQVIEAIETIRFFDDKVRIIILEGTRSGSETLLRQCFLNGIYNLIAADDFIKTKSSLEQCLLDGMSYKDALFFKEIETRKSKKPAALKVTDFHGKRIAFLGTQNRIGTTHCVLTAAYSLRKCGYLVAVMDFTRSMDYLNLMRSYEQNLNDNNGFTVDEIDFYISPTSGNSMNAQGNSYNFFIYDFGAYIHEEQKDTYVQADEKILVVGSKPWELPMLAEALRKINTDISRQKYLFNFANPEMETDLLKMMKGAGIEKDIYFMEYLSNFFSVSEVIKGMLQVMPQKTKKKWFHTNKR